MRFPYLFRQYVSWGDMDAYRHVNHAAFLKYFENARVEFFRSTGLWDIQPEENAKHIGIVAVKMEMEFRKQVRYPAVLDVTLGILQLQSRRIRFGCSIWDGEDQVFFSTGDFLWIDFSKQKVTVLPEVYLRYLEPFVVT